MSTPKRILLWVMGAFYVLAGIAHFVKPGFYRRIMPPFLPAHDALVVLSGVAEILCGLGVLHPRTRVLAAWGTIAFLVAIFPANIYDAIQGPGVLAWVRLPFQIPLVLWAWWYTREPRERDLVKT